jgi:hypothetical protein
MKSHDLADLLLGHVIEITVDQDPLLYRCDFLEDILDKDLLT